MNTPDDLLSESKIATGEAAQRIRDLQSKEKFLFQPLFIPYFLSFKKNYRLTHLETLVYGFIFFYLGNVKEKFFFSNGHLAEMLAVSEFQISRCINTLINRELIFVKYEIKGGGGKMRYVILNNVKEDDLLFSASRTQQKAQDNNNKSNDNKKIIYNGDHKNFSSQEDITEEIMVEIAEKYHVSIGYVALQWEKLQNWCGAKGHVYKNYKKALMNWVLMAMERSVERSQNDKYRAVDARNVQ